MLKASSRGIGLGLIGLVLSAQHYTLLPRKRSAVEAVPPWRQYTQDNSPPAKQFVFFDEAAAEYVVYFPEPLKTGDPGGGRMLSFRFRPQFIVDPHISVNVTRESDVYTYDYIVANGQSAREAIRLFDIVVPPAETPIRTSHGTWYASKLNGAGRPVAPQAALVGNGDLRKPEKMGRFVAWTCVDSAQPIKPGEKLDGFRVLSRALPGITTAYAATGRALRTPFEIPPEVMDQIVPLLLVENNYKTSVTIGPKFDVGTHSIPDIARDYQVSLSHLIGDGWASNSAYTQEMSRVLQSVAKSGQRGSIQFQSTPTSQLEKEIGAAIQIALGVSAGR
ncbi:MAG: hypothetical protein IT165_04430 [Bryobacterales bacterium]|nr:hypothetical protein [Bryobacterales bacterium]